MKRTELNAATQARMGMNPVRAKRKKVVIDPTFNPPGPGVFLRIKTSTPGNLLRHWRIEGRETKMQRTHTATMVAFAKERLKKLPALFGTGLSVQLTRYAPGTLDRFGNLSSSFKHIVDGIADAYGVDDKDPRWTFLEPIQVKTKRGQYGVRIEISVKQVKP